MRTTSTRVLVLVVLATLCVLGATGVDTTPTARAQEPVRLLVYGDSITQGSSGDWTWRCRLWQHLTSEGVPVDFVGPRSDLWTWREGKPGSEAYAEPRCDRDHAAYWGMSFRDAKYDVSDLVAEYHPDALVALIGVNDLVYGLQTPEELVDRWRSEITQARAVSAGTSFVLVPVPDTWFPRVSDYNALLPSLAAELDTQQSRVLVAADPRFDIDRDTYDNAHPSANGEVRIATVAADSLAVLGIGSGTPRPLPVVPPGPAFAPTPSVDAAENQIRVSWPLVEYANAERVWVRDVTGHQPWKLASGELSGTEWTTSATGGHTYAVRLQPVKVFLASGTRSAIVRARVPARPAAVTSLRTRKIRGCRRLISWRAAPFATGYSVRIRDVSAGGPWRVIQGSRVRSTIVRTGRLHRRHTFAVIVRSYGPLLGSYAKPPRFRSCR